MKSKSNLPPPTLPHKPNINWGLEFTKYIRKLQQTPKWKGFSYPCLATQKDIKSEFQRRKRAYLQNQKSKTVKHHHQPLGGSRRRRKKRNLTGGNIFSNLANQLAGKPPLDDGVPYHQTHLQNSYAPK
jgi:hypothetical protein